MYATKELHIVIDFNAFHCWCHVSGFISWYVQRLPDRKTPTSRYTATAAAAALLWDDWWRGNKRRQQLHAFTLSGTLPTPTLALTAIANVSPALTYIVTAMTKAWSLRWAVNVSRWFPILVCAFFLFFCDFGLVVRVVYVVVLIWWFQYEFLIYWIL